MSLDLSAAQAERRTRAEQLDEQWIEDRLNAVGLSDAVVMGTENVSPADRKKLSGIINRLRGKKHAFKTCMNDLRKHQPNWDEERRKKTCAVLKQLAKPGSTNASADTFSQGACVLVDEGVARLLEMADLSKLTEEEK